jgi:hypothetical protein
MQNVAWPITIVISENVRLLKLMNELSAIPVMIPGNAIGSRITSDTASRPKKRKRSTAKAAIEPSTSAIPVASSPARTDSHSAWRTSSLCQVEENQRVDSPDSGQLCTFEGLNAYSMMITIGKNRNSMISAANTANAIRLTRLVPITAPRTLPGAWR